MKKLILLHIILALISMAFITPAKAQTGDSSSTPLKVTAEDYKALLSRMEKLGIDPKDIEERFVGGGGKGKKRMAGVKLRHIPTGIIVEIRESKNQAINGYLARKALVEEIEKRRAEEAAAAEAAAETPAEEVMEETPPEEALAGEEAPSFDDEEVTLELEEPTQVYQYPEVPTFFTIGLGYHTARVEKGSASISETEYEEADDSVLVKTELRSFPFPNRLYFNIEYLNPEEYFGDLRYAYGDIVVLRYLNHTMFHNLDNILLVDGGNDPRYTVTQPDRTEDYGISTGMHSFSLRLKTPDFPFHVYALGEMVTSSGSRQLRYLSGSGYFNNLQKKTVKRKPDWTTTDLTAGFNTHAGFFEFDYSYNQKLFDAGSDNVLYDSYGAAGGRPAGVYAHNMTPDLISTTNTLKLHSSYNGRLVLSGTVAQTSAENDTNGAKADYLHIGGDAIWMPMHELTIFLKYRHKDQEVDNPDRVTVYDYTSGAPSAVQSYSVRDSLSSTSDRVNAIARVRPVKGVILNAEYSLEDISRTNDWDWHMASETVKNTGKLKLRVHASDKLVIKAGVAHETVDAPAYNTELDYTNKGNIAATWTPHPRFIAYLGYNLSVGKRDKVAYILNDQQFLVKDRSVENSKFVGMLGYSMTDAVSLTTSYSYFDTNVDQTIVFENFDASPQYLSDRNSPYSQKAHVIGADIHYRPGRLSLGGGVTHTISRADFHPHMTDASEPVPIDSFSNLETRETVYTVNGEYSFRGGFTLEIEYIYSDFNDVLDNPTDYTEDTVAHVALAKISKRW